MISVILVGRRGKGLHGDSEVSPVATRRVDAIDRDRACGSQIHTVCSGVFRRICVAENNENVNLGLSEALGWRCGFRAHRLVWGP